MFICFECKQFLESTDILKIHFKYYYMLIKHIHYTCAPENCPQSFSQLKTFISHLNNSHKEHKLHKNPTINIPNSQHNTIKSITKPPDHKTVNITDAVKIITENSPHFISKLNSYNNLTSTMINEIVGDLSTNIRKSFELIKQIVLPEIKSNKLEDISNLFEMCSNSYDNINSEYKLIKCLRERNLYKPPEQFTVAENITEISKKGVSTLSSKKLTGTIMPIVY